MNPEELCAAIASAEWIFDFFAIGFDYLLQFPPQNKKSPEAEVTREIFEAERISLHTDIEASDGLIPDSVYTFLGLERDTLREEVAVKRVAERLFWVQLLACLRSIDRSVESLSPFTFGHDIKKWKKVRQYCQEHKWRLNRAINRKVYFKPPSISTQPWFTHAESTGLKQTEQRGQYHHRFFQNLSLAPESPGCEVVLEVPRALDDMAEALPVPLRIAVCPVTDRLSIDDHEATIDPGRLSIVVDASRSRFSVIDTDAQKEVLQKIVEDALIRAVDVQADFLLFPELMIPDFLLDHLRKHLRGMVEAGMRTPRLVLAGSWMRSSSDGGRYNEAVLLNDRGGVLLRQRKMHRYGMQEHEQPKYGLRALFRSNTIEEDTDVTPRRLCFLDSRVGGFRLAILICEDLCQHGPGIALARDFSATILLSPVMAGPLSKEGGFYPHAAAYAIDPGALVCVANSGALANAGWATQRKPGSPPLVLVTAPLYGERFRGFSLIPGSNSGDLLTFLMPEPM